MSPLFALPFAAGAAVFYVSASWTMKAWGASPYLLLAPVVVALAAGAWIEAGSSRWRRLGYAVALALLASPAVAVTLTGEAYALREIAGAMVVFAGIALLRLPPAARTE